MKMLVLSLARWLVKVSEILTCLFCRKSAPTFSACPFLMLTVLDRTPIWARHDVGPRPHARTLELWRSQRECAPAAFSNSVQNGADCFSDGQTRLTPPVLTTSRKVAVLSDWIAGSIRRQANKGAPLYARNEKNTSDETPRSESRSERVYLPHGNHRRTAGGGSIHFASWRGRPPLAVNAVGGRC